MPDERNCTFCGGRIEPGTGRMFVKRDGTVHHFCSKKCYKNLVQLNRIPRRTRWSQKHKS